MVKYAVNLICPYLSHVEICPYLCHVEHIVYANKKGTYRHRGSLTRCYKFNTEQWRSWPLAGLMDFRSSYWSWTCLKYDEEKTDPLKCNGHLCFIHIERTRMYKSHCDKAL